MRLGRCAVYLGKEYTAWKKKDGRLLLRSADMEDMKLGFEPCEPFIYRWLGYEETVYCMKYVNRAEVSEFYDLKARAIYKGYEFQVVGQRDDEISIVNIDGDCKIWLNLGMERIDKFEYQKWIKKDEAEIRIERKDL